MERCISEIYLRLSGFNWPSGYRVSFRTGRSRVLSWVVFVLCFCYNLQCKLAASSSYGDFEACVNLLQACFTLVVTNFQKTCRLGASLLQICCKLKLLSGTDGWLTRWKDRNNIVYRKLHGEKQDAYSASAEDGGKNVWPTLIKVYKFDQIFNTDEIGLFFRALPEHTLLFKNGCEKVKERLTALLTCNMMGT
ncbi:hypothetical protein AVEN_196073-1 [Araneus ventricosus]|uniref:HTH CENPB-type domain-containing protein n=1 Tax=Araneus ventricosus TaxID=182803 RepID=A0A4Y2R425_ARAVE|nr:hypothetical protein AVEN_196073-1 [Araneus ventricosus]